MNIFDNLAEIYDILLPWSFRQEREGKFYPKLFKKYNVKKVLDCACGTGMHPIIFAQWGYDSYGSDISPEMINIAQKNSEKAGINIKFETVSFTEIDKKFQEKFDAIICVGNSLALADNLQSVEKAISQIYNHLNQNGIAVLHVSNFEKIINKKIKFTPVFSGFREDKEILMKRTFFACEEQVFLNITAILKNEEQKWVNQENITSLLPLRFNTLETILQDTGFNKVRMYSNPNFLRFRPLDSDDLYIVAQK